MKIKINELNLENNLWKLGDTSCRLANQISFYQCLLNYYFLEENKNHLDIYEYAREMNFKKKELNKPFHKKLMLLALKRLNLISKEKNQEEYEYTKKALLIDKLTSNSKFSNLFFKKTKIQWNVFIWFLSFLQFTIKRKNSEILYKPFLVMLKDSLEGKKINRNYIKKWSFFNFEEPNYKINCLKEIKWSKPPKNKEYLEEFLNILKSKDISKVSDFFKKISKSKHKVEKIISNYLKEKIGIFENFQKKENLKKISDFVSKISDNELLEFPNSIYRIKNEITALDEYWSLNKYWLVNSGIFELVNNTNTDLLLTKKGKKLAQWLNENILLNLNSENEIISIMDNDSILMDKFYDFLINLDNEDLENIPIPFTSDEVEQILLNEKECKLIDAIEDIRKNKDEFFKEKFEILSYKHEYLLYEYFVNLFFWYKFNLKEQNIHVNEIMGTILDNDLLPVSHSPSGNPDGFFEYKNEVFVIETTILNEWKEYFKKEYYQIHSHAINKQKENKKTNLIFVSKNFYLNSYMVSHLFNSNKKHFVFSEKGELNASILCLKINDLPKINKEKINNKTITDLINEILNPNTITKFNDNSETTIYNEIIIKNLS